MRLITKLALASCTAALAAGCTNMQPDMAVAPNAAMPADAPLAENYAARAAPVSELVDAVNIAYEMFTLDNGLKVIVSEDRKAPIVAVSVWYDVGSANEPTGKTGYAHLFEHIMFNGSENAPGDYFTYTKRIGATDLNGTTWLDRTNYFQTVPRSALESALFLESDRMGNLLGAVSQEKLDNQIGVVSNEKRQGDNQPYGLVGYKQIELLYPESHPYGHSTIGSLADLEAASLDDMYKWFTDHYGPNNAILVLSGDIDTAEARPLVQKWFGSIPKGPAVKPIETQVPVLDEVKTAVLHDKVPTTRIYRNWPMPGLNDPDFAALDVGASVLGGLASSRLDNILVREEQSAVAVSAYLLPFVHGSMMNVQVDVKPGEDADAVAARLDAIMADYIQNGPTAEEVKRVATSEAANRIAGLEQVGGFGGKAVALAQGELYSGDPEYYKKELERLAAMTPAKVTAAMQKYLTRPYAEIRVVPGERENYEEVSAGAGGKVVDGSAPAPNYYRAPEGDWIDAAPSNDLPLTFQDRSQFPEPGESPDLDFPEVETAELSNGIPVYFARRDAVPVVRVSVSFDAGYASDPKDALGTVGLMTTMLDEGTTSLDATALAEAQEALGASLSTGSSLDRTTVGVRAVKANLAPTLDLMADVIKNPAFDADELERVRVQQITRIQAESTQPQSLAFRVLPPMLYGEQHPYGVPFTGTGDADVVQRLTSTDLAGFHQRWMRPDKAKIFVVGDTTLAEIRPMLEERFGKWNPAGESAPDKTFSAPVASDGGKIIVINRPNSPQSLILAGEVLAAKGTDDILPLQASNEVLGGDFLSRINTDLRETKGWSYGAFSLIQRPQENVPFMVFAPVQTDQTGPSVSALIEQMGGFLGSNGVTEDELDRTVRGNTLELAGNFEQSSAVLSQIQQDVLYGRPLDYAETIADRYNALTAPELDAAMRDALDPAKLTWLIVGDAAKIQSQLTDIGLPVEYRGFDPDAVPAAPDADAATESDDEAMETSGQ